MNLDIDDCSTDIECDRRSVVTFSEPVAEFLIAGPKRELSVVSLPVHVTSILATSKERKRSVVSDQGTSRKVSFADIPLNHEDDN